MIESLTLQVKDIQNENKRLTDEVSTLEIELCQSDFFQKSGLADQYKKVKTRLLESELDISLSIESAGTAKYDTEAILK